MAKSIKPKTDRKPAREIAEPIAKSEGNAPVTQAARDDRIEQIRQRRARRDNRDVSGYRQKLAVSASRKDPNWEYRWVLDRHTRVEEMKERDWEVVDDAEMRDDPNQSGVGSVVQRIANERTVTQAERTVLMRKPREFFDEDKRIEQQRIKELEDGIQRGETRDPQGLSGPHSYIPEGGIKIKS